MSLFKKKNSNQMKRSNINFKKKKKIEREHPLAHFIRLMMIMKTLSCNCYYWFFFQSLTDILKLTIYHSVLLLHLHCCGPCALLPWSFPYKKTRIYTHTCHHTFLVLHNMFENLPNSNWKIPLLCNILINFVYYDD